MPPRSMKIRTPDRLRVTQVRRLPLDRFRRLLIRDIPAKPFLGDISLIHLRLPARTRLPNIHHRRTTELVYVLEGAMAGVLGGRRFRLRAGSLVYIPRGVWHKFETGPSPCSALAVFHPALSIGRRADIHGEPGVRLWD